MCPDGRRHASFQCGVTMGQLSSMMQAHSKHFDIAPANPFPLLSSLPLPLLFSFLFLPFPFPSPFLSLPSLYPSLPLEVGPLKYS